MGSLAPVKRHEAFYIGHLGKILHFTAKTN